MTSSDERYGYLHAERAAAHLRAHLPFRPRLAIILGSGLGPLSGEIVDQLVVPYSEIPYFPLSTAPGHQGELIAGRLDGVPIVALSGRVHLYEGYRVDQIVLPVRALARAGVQAVIITNAAGGVNAGFRSGTLMVIDDHINLTGANPLVGPNDPQFGPRFPDMSEVYSKRLRDLARRSAERVGVSVAHGVYFGLLGPSYETPAEIRMARTLGADAVGMSTVLEAIALVHMGVDVLGISCITNMAAGMLPGKLSHDEVVETANRVYGEFSLLIRAIVAEYAPL